MRNRTTIIVLSLVLIGVIALIGYLLFFRGENLNPKYNKLSGLKIYSQVNVRTLPIEVSFKTNPTLPKSAKVYKINRNLINENKAVSIASSLGISDKPREVTPKGENKVYYWHSSTQQLSIQQDSGSISYTNSANLKLGEASSIFIAEKDLIKKAQEFLVKVGLNSEKLKVDSENIVYNNLSGEDSIITSDKSQANIVEIDFNLILDNRLLFLQDPTQAPVKFLLNRSGEVFQFYYELADYKDEGAVYPINPVKAITPTQIRNYGVFVAPTGQAPVLNSKLIRDLLIEDIDMVYVADKSSEYLMPTYLLRGVATLGDKKILGALYVPAVTKEWLK